MIHLLISVIAIGLSLNCKEFQCAGARLIKLVNTRTVTRDMNVGPNTLKKNFLWLVVFLCLGSAHSCKKENIQPLLIVSVEVGGADLNNTAIRVAVSAPIKAAFTTSIDPWSVSATSVLMTRDYDQTAVSLILIVSGTELSIKPAVNLVPGASYTLTITSDVKSTHGDAFGSFTITFKTAGIFVPSNQVAYWNFEHTPPDDVVGTYDPISTDVVDIAYEISKNDSSGR